MSTAIKHPATNLVKPSFVIFDIQHSDNEPERQSARMSKIANDGWHNQVCRRMLYSGTHMATVSVKWLTVVSYRIVSVFVSNQAYDQQAYDQHW